MYPTPMKSLYLTGQINEEMAQKTITFFNDLGDNKATVYISSHGGQNHNAEIIVNQIVQRINNTQVLFLNQCFSSAFWMFVNLAKYETTNILGPVQGMYHRSHMEISLDSSGRPNTPYDTAEKNYLQEFEAQNDGIMLIIGATEKESKAYKRQADVFFSTVRMREIIEHLRKSNIKPIERVDNH